MIIYMATNKVNGKKYIGQTVCGLARRRGQHLYKAKNGKKSPFYNAIRKYGAEAFEWIILDTVNDIDELNAREEYYIAAYETCAPKGYNIKFGGGNRRQPLSVRKKLSVVGKGRKHTEEQNEAKSERMKGKKRKPHTEETKKKISEVKKGLYAGAKHPSFDPKIYAFWHKDAGIVACTRYALQMEYGLNHGHLSGLASGKKKSLKGWTMASNIKEVA